MKRKQPVGLARAQQQQREYVQREAMIDALERIAAALEALQIVPLPEPCGIPRVAIRMAKAGGR